ncbi:hypothetical protein G5V59_17195 [Nocardioides sp. W3-2-3]|uniref:hypothetical protein n=1 Tax=Nocardioides convexus TaxID=2712224 RepID=UPI0024186E21|nr:hypothetical protein [Nocardioides convexus]NHA01032.1 hypothetical protein [Nocardioides convexus]
MPRRTSPRPSSLIASSAGQADRLAQPEPAPWSLRLVRAQHLRRIDSPAGAAEEAARGGRDG